MIVVIYVIMAFIVFAFIYNSFKLVFNLIMKVINRLRKNKIEELNNEYIIKQKIIDENEKKYNDYLNWMQKRNNGSVPIEKIKTKEEFEAEKKINQLLK